MANSRATVATLVLSAATLVGIAGYESFKPVAYIPVPGDVPTIGYGETHGVHLGDRTTPERALVQLLASAESHADGVRKCIEVPMYQHEFAAAVSIAYNIGVGAFCRSTMVKKLNAGDYRGFCEGMTAWSRSGGKVYPGLVKRREKERALCLGEAA